MNNTLAGKCEKDPNGKNQHESGAKLDAGKPRPGLVLGGFAAALAAVVDVGTYGAQKYTDNGWKDVPNGIERYTDAMYRHLLAESRGDLRDEDTGILHSAHTAWNALARLDLLIRGKPGDVPLQAQVVTAYGAYQPAEGTVPGAHYNAALGKWLR